MKTSIAMATYNGARYLQEQLESFVAQTHLPDELVITDDGSTDQTLEIVEAFSRNAPFEVRFFSNETNLGYARNFSRALSLCTGDLIFLSDQDDIWLTTKIRNILKLAEEHQETMLFMNDTELINCDGSPLGLTKLGQTFSLGLGESDFTTGCCMALRSTFVRLALPVPTPEFVHDTWLNRLALLLQVKLVTPQVMQFYRRHGDNASDWLASRTTRQSKLDLIKAYWGQDPRPYAFNRLKQLDYLQSYIGRCNFIFVESSRFQNAAEAAIQEIKRERYAVDKRLQFLQVPRWRRFVPAASLYFNGYYRYFSGWKSLIKDVICI